MTRRQRATLAPTVPLKGQLALCHHSDGWRAGCPSCEAQERLALELVEPRRRAPSCVHHGDPAACPGHCQCRCGDCIPF